MDERSSLIHELEEYFAARKDVGLALLYGSFAAGTQGRESDVDIAVHTAESASLECLIDIQSDIGALSHREVDVLDLRRAEGMILCHAIRQGIKIKNDPMLFSYYNLKAIYFHEDYLPLLRSMQRAYIEKFVRGS